MQGPGDLPPGPAAAHPLPTSDVWGGGACRHVPAGRHHGLLVCLLQCAPGKGRTIPDCAAGANLCSFQFFVPANGQRPACARTTCKQTSLLLLASKPPSCWRWLDACCQDAPLPSSREAAQAEALRAVAGWSWGIEDAIRSTPLDTLSRSRVADRWTIGGVGRGSVTLVGEDMGWGQAATGGGGGRVSVTGARVCLH
jgi:hypothetical protein